MIISGVLGLCLLCEVVAAAAVIVVMDNFLFATGTQG